MTCNFKFSVWYIGNKTRATAISCNSCGSTCIVFKYLIWMKNFSWRAYLEQKCYSRINVDTKCPDWHAAQTLLKIVIVVTRCIATLFLVLFPKGTFELTTLISFDVSTNNILHSDAFLCFFWNLPTLLTVLTLITIHDNTLLTNIATYTTIQLPYSNLRVQLQ